MIEQDFICTDDFEANGIVKWNSPSNIALVKYWGKKDNQIPQNPSISFTLSESYTTTSVEFKPKKNNNNNILFDFEGEKNHPFGQKIKLFISSIEKYFKFLKNHDIHIKSQNNFPHSSGIASSASGFSAIALAIVELEQEITGFSENDKYLKASFLSRLGSGSASRSLYGPAAIWGLHEKVPNSSNEFAIEHSDLHQDFKSYQDTILLIDKGTKKVSSTAGHDLMNNHPFSKQRFFQAYENLESMIEILKNGDLEKFISLSESEALTLHAMMMTSNPYFLLMKEGTLSAIEKVWSFRKESDIPLSFTLDAGANLHLLYPKAYKQKVLDFIEGELIVYCEKEHYICDEVGSGAKILKANYA